jgi:hypothetical protein
VAKEELIGAVMSLVDCYAETGLANLLKLVQYRSLVDGRLSERSRGGGWKGEGLCAAIASVEEG